MNLTSHFTLDELTFSQDASRAGIRNEPNAEHTENLRALCTRILQPLRDHLRKPVVITSGFRTPSVNRRIGGARGSQHSKGMAADIYVPGMSIPVLVDKIASLHLPFDQLIDEFGRWVHVSHDPHHAPRKMILRAVIQSGKTSYIPVKGI